MRPFHPAHGAGGFAVPERNEVSSMTNDAIVLESELRAKILPVSRSTLWRWESNGDFPKRRKLGPRRVGWLRSDIDEWLQSRPTA